MSTNYPSAKQTFTDPLATDFLNSPSHSVLHTDKNDTLEAIQDRIGFGSQSTPGAADLFYKSTSATGSEWFDLFGTANSWTAEQVFTAGAQFNDNDAASFGAGDDLQILHNGTDNQLIAGQDIVTTFDANDAGVSYEAMRITPSDATNSERQVSFANNQSIRIPTLVRGPTGGGFAFRSDAGTSSQMLFDGNSSILSLTLFNSASLGSLAFLHLPTSLSGSTPANIDFSLVVQGTGSFSLTSGSGGFLINGAGGGVDIRANAGQTIHLNSTGVDSDIIGSGSSITNLWYVDSGANRVGINTGTPSALFHVAGASLLAGNTDIGATTGVRLSAASGVLTLAGIGNTNNENLTFNFEASSNVVTIGSSSGVTSVRYASGIIPRSNQREFGPNGTVRLGTTTSNRLDLASGDSFYIISGGLGVGVINTAVGTIDANLTVRGTSFIGDGDPGSGLASTNIFTGVTDTPTTDPGWASSSTIDMNAPDGYIKAYVGTQAVVIPYWNT